MAIKNAYNDGGTNRIVKTPKDFIEQLKFDGNIQLKSDGNILPELFLVRSCGRPSIYFVQYHSNHPQFGRCVHYEVVSSTEENKRIYDVSPGELQVRLDVELDKTKSTALKSQLVDLWRRLKNKAKDPSVHEEFKPCEQPKPYDKWFHIQLKNPIQFQSDYGRMRDQVLKKLDLLYSFFEETLTEAENRHVSEVAQDD